MTVSPIPHLRPALALLIVLLGVLSAAPGAGAAVAYRDKTCTTKTNTFGIPPYSITLNKPATAVAGDLLIATARWSAFYSSQNSPAGWTEMLGNGNDTTSWYRIVQAGDTNWDFTMPSGPGSAVGGITAFSGVNTSDPFFNAGVQTTSGTAASVALPNISGITQAGSMRYSVVASGASVSSTFTGMSEACDVTVGSLGLGSAYEVQNAGNTTSRTDTRSGSGANVAQTYVLNPIGACGGGSLSLVQPAPIAFPTTVLDGNDQPQPASAPMTVADMTGSSSGWSLGATSTTFVNGAWNLGTGATTVTGAGAVAAGGNCTMPTNSITYPQTLPAAASAPAAIKIFNAAGGTGQGPLTVTPSFSLMVPGRAHVGTYSSTWTFTLATGP